MRGTFAGGWESAPRGAETIPSARMTASPILVSLMSSTVVSSAGELTRDGLPPAVRLIGLLAVEAERLEHRRVLDREENGLALGGGVGVLVPRPRWDGEHIPRPPAEALAAEHAEPAPLEDHVHRARNVAMGAGVDARPEALDPTGERREHGATRRVDVLKGEILKGGRVPLSEPHQGGRRLGPRIRPPVVRRLSGRLRLFVKLLEEAGVQQAYQGNVEPVEPDRGLLAHVAMVVPEPGRRQDQVTPTHHLLLAPPPGSPPGGRGAAVAPGRRRPPPRSCLVLPPPPLPSPPPGERMKVRGH